LLSPGLDEVFGTRLSHPIDGDGVVCAISFLPVRDGSGQKKVHFRSRFVRTEHHCKEKEARKFLYRGQMGTQSTSRLQDTITTIKESAVAVRTAAAAED
jgi:all-trans-8'-apo-beta-carotenal 15,15'-oxygenase